MSGGDRLWRRREERGICDGFNNHNNKNNSVISDIVLVELDGEWSSDTSGSGFRALLAGAVCLGLVGYGI